MTKNLGGIRVKVITMIIIIILSTTIILSTVILNITEDALKEKAFEVSQTLISTISDFSSTALYERSYSTKITIDELLKKIKDSKTNALLDISIFYTKKINSKISYHYYAGFGNYKLDEELSKEKLTELRTMREENLNHITNRYGKTKTLAYQFVEHVQVNFDSQPIEIGVVILSYDTNAINAVIQKVINLSYLATIIILAIGIFFANHISILLSTPIIKISKAAKQISSGDLNIHLDINTNDEIGRLAQEFNSMVEGLQERVKMKKFVSNSTMDMISKKDLSNINLGGEYKTQTFLFSDIRDFTAMSETHRPKEVVSIINFYLNLQSEIIIKHGGDIDKYIGDEIMATFSSNDAPKKAMNAAIEIQRSIKEQNIIRIENKLTACEVGIGINEGEVIVGNIGSNTQMDFTSVGSGVNLAARLCSYAKPFEVLISKKSLSFEPDSFGLVDAPSVSLKGFSKPVEVYSLLLEDIS